MTSCEKLELRAAIKFCQQLGDTPTSTFKKIIQAKGEKSASRALVFSWHKRFREGEERIENKKRECERTKITTSLITLIEKSLNEDRRLTVRTLAEMHDASVGTIHTILTKKLNMRKVHARWVPRLLTDDEMKRRVVSSKNFLKRVKKEGDMFLSRIITTDETWLWLHDPETKSQSAVWKRNGSPPPKKARVSKSGGKYMFVMFADMDGMLLQHVVPKGMTVNAEYFSKVLSRDLTTAIRKKRPGIPLEHFLLHMDNASSHTADLTSLELAVLGLETVSHPPYSPDLAPFDFSIFPTIKSQLKGLRFGNLQELQAESQRIVRQYDSSWYRAIYQQWVHRHRRCIECDGAYFEKE